MVLSCIAFVFLAATSQASGASTLACISSSRSSCSSDFHILSSSLRLRGGSAAAAPTNPAAAASAAPAVPPPPPRDPQAELLQAAYDGDVVLAEEVIELGADPNKLCDSGENMLHPNALHVAAFQGHASLVEKLVALGAQVNYANRHGYTGLHFAGLTGKLETCKMLVALGADLGAKDRFGDQPVDRAEQAGAKDCKDYLEVVMKKNGVERAWGGYRIPDEVKEMVEDAGKFVEEMKKADAVIAPIAPAEGAASTSTSNSADFIPRFMLDGNGNILPQYSSVADLAYAKKKLLEKQGLEVPEFLKIIEMIQADDDEAVSELLKWTPGSGSSA